MYLFKMGMFHSFLYIYQRVSANTIDIPSFSRAHQIAPFFAGGSSGMALLPGLDGDALPAFWGVPKWHHR